MSVPHLKLIDYNYTMETIKVQREVTTPYQQVLHVLARNEYGGHGKYEGGCSEIINTAERRLWKNQ